MQFFEKFRNKDLVTTYCLIFLSTSFGVIRNNIPKTQEYLVDNSCKMPQRDRKICLAGCDQLSVLVIFMLDIL